MKPFSMSVLFVFLSGLFLSCQSGQQPINYGEDSCHYCKMTISDVKFGAQLITDKGRVLNYDAAECMVNHLKDDKPKYRDLYAVAYDRPETLYPVDSLHFIISPDFRSPMGENLAAFSQKSSADEKYQDQFISWQKVVSSIGRR